MKFLNGSLFDYRHKNPVVSIARDHFQYHKYILHDSYIRSTVQYYMYLYKLNTHKVVEDCPVVFPAFQYFPKMQQYCSFFLCSLTWEIQVQCVQSNILLIWNDYYFIHPLHLMFWRYFFKKMGVLEMKVSLPYIYIVQDSKNPYTNLAGMYYVFLNTTFVECQICSCWDNSTPHTHIG